MNYLKTTILLAALTGILVFIGYYFGGQEGALIAFILSAVMNLGSYWFSDRIVLSMYSARLISESELPFLHNMVTELSMIANIPKPRLYLVDLPVPNAFATGRNPANAAVAVTTGILKLLSEAELRGVIAHELSHVKNRDILISSIAATLAGAISYIAQFAFYLGGGARDDEERSSPLGMIAMLILTPILATLLHLAVSRSREYGADETGAAISHAPRDLASALRKLHGYAASHPLQGEPKHEATAHMFIVNPFRASLLMSLLSTHPPVEERIARLERM